MVLLTVCSWQLAVRLGCHYFIVHLKFSVFETDFQTCSSGNAEAPTADCLPAGTINANKMQQSPDLACSQVHLACIFHVETCWSCASSSAVTVIAYCRGEQVRQL